MKITKNYIVLSLLLLSSNNFCGGIKTQNSIDIRYSTTQQTALYTGGVGCVFAGLCTLLLAARGVTNTNNNQSNMTQIILNAVTAATGLLITGSGIGLMIIVPKITTPLSEAKKE